MFYQANSRTAQVMGQDAGSVSISASSADYIPTYQQTFSGMSRDSVVDKVLAEVTATYNTVKLASKGGKTLFTSEVAQNVANMVAASNAALTVMIDMYGDTAFETVYPSKWKTLVSKQEEIARLLKVLVTWNPAVGDVSRGIVAKQHAALAVGDLDSPWVGQGMKKAVLDMAYGMGINNPVYDSIREKYNPSGEYKIPTEGVKIYTREERMKLIAGEFEKAGVPMPARDFPLPGTSAPGAASEPAGGIGGRGLVAAAIAGVVAFFALR